jgi:AcrR family transcriptional regulator
MRKIPRQISDRLPAAADLFAEKGLNDSKIEDVAAVTGVPKATLYYYFAGKEDILAFLLEDLLKDIFDAVTAIVHTGGTGAERLELVIRAQLRAMAQRPAVCRALIGELGRAARMPAIAEMINTAYQQPVETLLIEGPATDPSSLSPMRDRRRLRCSARSPSMHSCTWSPITTSTRRWSPAPSAPSCSTGCARAQETSHEHLRPVGSRRGSEVTGPDRPGR